MTDAQRRHDPIERSFASDNWAGAHPEVLEALSLANEGHQASYGDDVYTENLQRVFRRHFGGEAAVYPVFNGTGANVVSLQAMTERWESVVCAETGHVQTDEAGAAERLAGIKLLAAGATDAKIDAAAIDKEAFGWDNAHRAAPRVVSVTQSTELGTCYTPEELAAICDRAHHHEMTVHVDGARLSNAAASLGLGFKEFTTDVGVDVVSFGGTKNGLVFGEAIVVLNPAAVRAVPHLRMSSMQLASKMRFISAQFEALLGGDLWLRSATHANSMAKRLEAQVRGIAGVEVSRPVQANAVFARLPHRVIERLQKRVPFHTWDATAGEVRWMCAFDTTEADIDDFAVAIGEEMRAGA